MVDYTGKRIGNRTIIDHAYQKRTPGGKLRDFWRWRCDCGAEFVDIYGNIKARAHGACKSCSEKGGAGARKDFTGQVFGDRTIVKLIRWNEDSEHSVYRARCGNGHVSEATLDAMKRRGCMRCFEEYKAEEVRLRVGQVYGNRKILRYLGIRKVGKSRKLRGFYRYRCLLCGAVHKATYSNIIVSQDKKCLKCRNRKNG